LSFRLTFSGLLLVFARVEDKIRFHTLALGLGVGGKDQYKVGGPPPMIWAAGSVGWFSARVCSVPAWVVRIAGGVAGTTWVVLSAGRGASISSIVLWAGWSAGFAWVVLIAGRTAGFPWIVL
jgi:hypothetical protein